MKDVFSKSLVPYKSCGSSAKNILAGATSTYFIGGDFSATATIAFAAFDPELFFSSDNDVVPANFTRIIYPFSDENWAGLLSKISTKDAYRRGYSAAGDLVDLSRPAALDKKGGYDTKFFETRTLLLNISSGFYTVFGVHYNIFYYPITRVFESHPRMRQLAGRAANFLKTRVSRDSKSLL